MTYTLRDCSTVSEGHLRLFGCDDLNGLLECSGEHL